MEDSSDYKLRPSKHFILGWMRKWGWDIQDLKNSIENLVSDIKNKYD